MSLNIPDPKKFQVRLDDVYTTAANYDNTTRSTVVEKGEATLVDVIKEGMDLSVGSFSDGKVTIDILPKKLDDPPTYVRVFGALYQRVDTL